MEELEKKISEYKKKLNHLRGGYRAVEEKIEAMEEGLHLPGIKKKYEGKYFRYRNAYNSDDTWWLYYRVKKVTSTMNCIVDTFQTDSYGEAKIKLNDRTYISHLEHKITRAQWNSAAKAVWKKANQL